MSVSFFKSSKNWFEKRTAGGTDWGEDSNLLPKTFFWLLHLLPLLIGKVKHFVVACGSKIRGFSVQGEKKGLCRILTHPLEKSFF